MRASLRINDLSFTWPDGTTVFDGLDLTLGPGRHGLIGLNGSGKSTLLRLIAGDVTPQHGSICLDGTLAHLPQDPGTRPEATVSEVLGISATLAALRRIESGSTAVEDFDMVGDDWDIAERTQAELSRLGLGSIEPDRPVGSLSGGELVLLSLVARLLTRPSVLLLDEPTNNLDDHARARLMDAVAGWSGILLVVSHDRQVLNSMDDIGEVRGGAVTWYGGTYDDYEAAVAAEQNAAERAVRAAESELRAQRRDLVEAQAKLSRSARQGRQQADKGGIPRIIVGGRKRAAQQTAGRITGLHQNRIEAASTQLDEAAARLRTDREIRVDLPDTIVPPGRRVLTLDGIRPMHGDLVIDLDLRGPERIGLTGPNGAGKTTLLRIITGQVVPAAGSVHRYVPLGHLPQRLDLLDDQLTVAQNIARIAPSATENQRRAQLARFLFRGRDADHAASTLSGGQRLRATLACLLLAEPAPQLLLLDEPTNNLDLSSTAHLVEALRAYAGAFIVVSHDERFLDHVDLTRRIELPRPR